jgi:hypothetical protein
LTQSGHLREFPLIKSVGTRMLFSSDLSLQQSGEADH